jgi:integrase
MFDRRGQRKYLNSAERRVFLQTVKKEADPLRRAFCLALFYTGCRISEALNLHAERLDQTGKAIVFETLKRRRLGCFRSVPIPDNLAETCRDLAEGLEPQSRLWPFSRASAYRLVKEQMALAGIIGGMASPKGLRHGFAVACLGQKIPLTTLQKWMGHARLETTAIYLEVFGDEERELARRLWLAD